jgi:hypothetical protein
MAVTELKRIGWLDNPVINRLYDLGNTGVWIARQDSITPIERGIRYYLGLVSNQLDTTVAGDGIAKVLGDRITEARMDRLDTDLSTLNTSIGSAVAHLAALVACIDGNRLKTIETP